MGVAQGVVEGEVARYHAAARRGAEAYGRRAAGDVVAAADPPQRLWGGGASLLGCDRPIRCGQRTLGDVPCGEGWVEVLLLCPVAVYTAIWAVALCVMG